MHLAPQVVLFSAALALGVAALAGEPQKRDSPNSAIDRGRALYARHCSHCHGFNMVNPGTIAYDLRRFPRDDEPRFLDSVTNGKNGRMPPWKGVLSQEEIRHLWAYVVSGGKN